VPFAQVCIAGGGGGFVAQAASTTVVARISVSLISLSFGAGDPSANEMIAATFLASESSRRHSIRLIFHFLK